MSDNNEPIPPAVINALSRQAYTIGYLRGALMGLLWWPYVKQSPDLVAKIEQILGEMVQP